MSWLPVASAWQMTVISIPGLSLSAAFIWSRLWVWCGEGVGKPYCVCTSFHTEVGSVVWGRQRDIEAGVFTEMKLFCLVWFHSLGFSQQ